MTRRGSAANETRLPPTIDQYMYDVISGNETELSSLDGAAVQIADETDEDYYYRTGWLWGPYVTISIVLTVLIIVSFIRFHCLYGHRYRNNSSSAAHHYVSSVLHHHTDDWSPTDVAHSSPRTHRLFWRPRYAWMEKSRSNSIPMTSLAHQAGSRHRRHRPVPTRYRYRTSPTGIVTLVAVRSDVDRSTQEQLGRRRQSTCLDVVVEVDSEESLATSTDPVTLSRQTVGGDLSSPSSSASSADHDTDNKASSPDESNTDQVATSDVIQLEMMPFGQLNSCAGGVLLGHVTAAAGLFRSVRQLNVAPSVDDTERLIDDDVISLI